MNFPVSSLGASPAFKAALTWQNSRWHALIFFPNTSASTSYRKIYCTPLCLQTWIWPKSYWGAGSRLSAFLSPSGCLIYYLLSLHINKHFTFKLGNLDNILMKHLVLCILKIHSETESRKTGDLPRESKIYTLEGLTVRRKLTDFILEDSNGAKLEQQMKVTCTGIASRGD